MEKKKKQSLRGKINESIWHLKFFASLVFDRTCSSAADKVLLVARGRGVNFLRANMLIEDNPEVFAPIFEEFDLRPMDTAEKYSQICEMISKVDSKVLKDWYYENLLQNYQD